MSRLVTVARTFINGSRNFVPSEPFRRTHCRCTHRSLTGRNSGGVCLLSARTFADMTKRLQALRSGHLYLLSKTMN